MTNTTATVLRTSRRRAGVILAALAGLSAAVLAAGYVLLLGGGSVVGQEAGLWPTTKAAVQTRVLGAQMVQLTPDKYVVRGDAGEQQFFAMLRERGITPREQMGAGWFYDSADGQRCAGGSRMFTSALMVWDVPVCR